MSETINSGIEAIGDVAWGTHFCQFYETADDLVSTLVPYFKAGLDGSERCMWVTAQPLRAHDATDALRNAVPELDRRLARGDIEIMDHDQWYQTGQGKMGADAVISGWLQRKEEALSRGYAGLRVTGNTYFLEANDWDSFAEYEAKVNGCLCDQRILTLCSYCTLRCDAGGALDVVQNHEFALARRRGAWTMIESSSVKQAKGALARANAELEQRVEQRTGDLRRALSEKDALLKEVHHRVKNNLQVVAALIQLRAKQSADPAGRDAFAETLRRIKAMSLVHDQLYGGQDTSGINFAEYLGSLAAATVTSYGMSGQVTVEVAPCEDLVDLNTAIPLGLAAAEGLANALKHGFPDARKGRLWLSFQAPTDDVDGELTIRDDGVGIPDPMPATRRGAGLALATALAGQIGGRISLTRQGGTVWRLTYPAPRPRINAFGMAGAV
ncbi:MEDS domain-containing protein [Roseomonas sp. SSH11]|uniref:histidine kinase n=1 Tax=Pararoseomonas baculiformis TaxID=2820812 RepID=A0ABS4AIA1_9PROT|nr:MEDS domain-containing protein [Pararoseomonas baculiformis]MBP0446744.1 MEDS domain-containing protein [Pararoseomonas baculiformis]